MLNLLGPASKCFVHGRYALKPVGVGDKSISFLAICQAILGANLQLVHAAEHIKQCARHAGCSANHDRVANRDQIKPANTTRPTSGCSKLAAALANTLANFIQQLGGKRTRANARCVGLHNSKHAVNLAARHSGAGGNS